MHYSAQAEKIEMTEEERIKIQIVQNRMLNEYGMSQLINQGVFKKLVQSLSVNDLENLVDNKIYFNPLFSPASQTELKNDLERGSKIITIDLNTFKLFNSSEGTAIILHEIGHALSPKIKGMEGEFIADGYALERGYKQYIIDSLETGKTIRPDEFVSKSTDDRIKRLRNL